MNAPALARCNEAATNGSFRAMQHLRDRPGALVPRKIQEKPIVALGPREAGAFLAALRESSGQPQFCRAPPDYVRSPIRMAVQKLAYRFRSSPPSTCVSLPKDLFVVRFPYRSAI